jgi:ATP-binding cassette subfamily F protein uup
MVLPVLTLHDACLNFGTRPLFSELNVNVLEDDHLCLIGRNGQGKSTLLKVMANIIELDSGRFYQKPGSIIHYLPQDLALPQGATAREVVMASTPHAYEADALLDALEMNPTRTMEGLSGGEKRRILLARTFAGNPDVLLLDEPTNHLDIKAIQWLEDYLSHFAGAILTISHDRRFLANTAKGTLWLDRGKLRRSNQSYKHFDAWQEQLMDAETKELEKLQSKLRLEEHWKQRGVTARRKRNQGRLERLMEMRRRRSSLLANQAKSATLTTADKALGSQLVVEAKEVTKAFPGSLALQPFSTRIFKGDRIGIVGPNGCGKSTLLKMLVGQLTPDSGRVRLGKTLDIAYFEQERDTMNPDETPWQYLCPTGGDSVTVHGRTMHVVGYLKQFLFDDKQARGKISILSGGEKNRLQLAKVLAKPSNVLILDEPTNDLDMDTLDLLIDMLTDYPGTLILISHDRDFIDQLVTGVFAIHPNGAVVECLGGYSEYEKLYGSHTLVETKKAMKTEAPPAPLPRAKVAKKLTYRDQRDYDLIPTQLEAMAKRQTDIEALLHDPLLFTHDPTRFDALTKELEGINTQRDTLETRWLELDALASNLT